MLIEVFQNNVPDWRKTEINYPLHTHLLTQDRNQAYTSLVEGIEGMKLTKRLYRNKQGSIEDVSTNTEIERNAILTDILENVVKPLYGKEALDKTPLNKV